MKTSILFKFGFVLIFPVGIVYVAVADPTHVEPAKLFDYSLIVEAQRKCDNSQIANLKYPDNRKEQFTLAKKARAIISNLSLKEVSRKSKLARGETFLENYLDLRLL